MWEGSARGGGLVLLLETIGTLWTARTAPLTRPMGELTGFLRRRRIDVPKVDPHCDRSSREHARWRHCGFYLTGLDIDRAPAYNDVHDGCISAVTP